MVLVLASCNSGSLGGSQLVLAVLQVGFQASLLL